MNTNPNYAAQMMQQLDTTVTLRLITVLEDIEAANDPVNIPFYDSLNESLSYMLTPEELERLTTREISTDWLATVAAFFADVEEVDGDG
jgi:DNA polymerase III psi subunit